MKFLTQDQLIAIKESRFNDLLCYDCTAKTANRIVGHAFTSYECARCKRQCSYQNTGAPNYCTGCAYESFKCQRCMESLDKDIKEVNRDNLCSLIEKNDSNKATVQNVIDSLISETYDNEKIYTLDVKDEDGSVYTITGYDWCDRTLLIRRGE